MEFKMPVANRERMEQLLEYLGDTSRYSEYYDGNRAEDFKKCFDIESEWCWKYADLVLRGMDARDIGYGERHHIIPFTYYKSILGKVSRKSCLVNDSNLCILNYVEHIYAHFCMAHCACNKNLKIKMARAFCHMSGFTSKIDINGTNLIDSISKQEKNTVRLMMPSVANVEAEGRTHFWENPKQAAADWRALNREEAKIRSSEWYANNKDRAKEWWNSYSVEHHDEIQEQRKKFRENNREILRQRSQDDYYNHYDERRMSRKRIYDAKIAAGYKYRKDPVTGKRGWVFVGLPEQEVAA